MDLLDFSMSGVMVTGTILLNNLAVPLSVILIVNTLLRKWVQGVMLHKS